MTKKIFLGVVIFLFFLSFPFLSLAGSSQFSKGNCSNFTFHVKPDNSTEINDDIPLLVSQHESPVYGEKKGGQIVTRLDFRDRVEALRVSESPEKGRIEIRRKGERNPLGWIERKNLLCIYQPLKNDSRIERKLYIQTPVYKEGETPKLVSAFHTSDQKKCKDTCNSLGRFELLFVFDFDSKNKTYLLARNFNLLREEARLIGWVAEDNGIPWNTALGLRPDDQVEEIDIFLDKEDAIRQFSGQDKKTKKGIKVLGNKDRQWYTFPRRISILESIPTEGGLIYKVATPSIGAEAAYASSDSDPGIKKLAQWKNVDIFFLLDGTASMRPYINRVGQVARNIVERFQNLPSHRNTQFRFGFRVYRDHYARNQGIGEALSFSNLHCVLSQEKKNENLKAFEKGITKIKKNLIYNEEDDFPETLYIGLNQALEDIRACPNHAKILIVIGDHGDHLDKIPLSLKLQLSRLRKNNFFIPFFIQSADLTQSNQVLYKNIEAYKFAYQRFRTQAMELLEITLPARYDNAPVDRNSHLLSLNTQDLSNKITERVGKYSSSEVIEDIIHYLKGGMSLKDYLQSRVKSKDKDLPILYWAMIGKLCEELSRQCKEQIDHRVTTAYVPFRETEHHWEVEAWMRRDDMEDWLYVLRRLTRVLGRSATAQREEFIKTLGIVLQELLKRPPIRDSGETLAEYLSRKEGLPLNVFSPFLQYEINEIREMESCEFLQLALWIQSINGILSKILALPNQKIDFQLQEFPGHCPRVNPAKKIPRLIEGRPFALGPSEKHSYEQQLENTTIFWLPIKYLP